LPAFEVANVRFGDIQSHVQRVVARTLRHLAARDATCEQKPDFSAFLSF
jgi:hypothetical protein